MAEFLCFLNDIPDNGILPVSVNGRQIAVVRLGSTVYAIEDRCPHWGGPLSLGQVAAARREIVCPWHRFRYALGDGTCVASRGRRSARTFPVQVEDGRVFADIATEEAGFKGRDEWIRSM